MKHIFSIIAIACIACGGNLQAAPSNCSQAATCKMASLCKKATPCKKKATPCNKKAAPCKKHAKLRSGACA